MQVLDLNRLINDQSFHSITRITAQRIQRETYFRPGDWLKALGDADLLTLLHMCDNMVDSADDPYAQTISTLAMLLAMAEGIDFQHSMIYRNVGVLCTMLAAESLSRQGIVDITYDAISLEPSDVEVIRFSDKYKAVLKSSTEQQPPSESGNENGPSS